MPGHWPRLNQREGRALLYVWPRYADNYDRPSQQVSLEMRRGGLCFWLSFCMRELVSLTPEVEELQGKENFFWLWTSRGPVLSHVCLSVQISPTGQREVHSMLGQRDTLSVWGGKAHLSQASTMKGSYQRSKRGERYNKNMFVALLQWENEDKVRTCLFNTRHDHTHMTELQKVHTSLLRVLWLPFRRPLT